MGFFLAGAGISAVFSVGKARKTIAGVCVALAVLTTWGCLAATHAVLRHSISAGCGVPSAPGQPTGERCPAVDGLP